MSLTIRGPASRHAWKPHVAVFRRRPPIAVVVEIFNPNQIARTVTSRTRVIIAALSRVRPVVELVGVVDLLHLGGQLRRAAERYALSRMDGVFLAIPGRNTFAFANRHYRVIAVLRSFNPIPSGLKGSKRLVRSVDFKNIVAAQSAHSYFQRSGTQFDLHRAIVKI